jgi:hypothetical protein
MESLARGTSLMPEGFEQQPSQRPTADLLTYLKTWRLADEARNSGVVP